jgi:hypothetical protein
MESRDSGYDIKSSETQLIHAESVDGGLDVGCPSLSRCIGKEETATGCALGTGETVSRQSDDHWPFAHEPPEAAA